VGEGDIFKIEQGTQLVLPALALECIKSKSV
jgi:hypothetical protein